MQSCLLFPALPSYYTSRASISTEPTTPVVYIRDGSKSLFASPSQVTSHFRASPSQVTSHLVRRQVKSQVIWSKHKSSHKSLCPSTSQVAHYFSHSRHKKGNIIKSKRKLEIAQSEQDVSPFCKESDMTYS